jgi:hypothetical protein
MVAMYILPSGVDVPTLLLWSSRASRNGRLILVFDAGAVTGFSRQAGEIERSCETLVDLVRKSGS